MNLQNLEHSKFKSNTYAGIKIEDPTTRSCPWQHVLNNPHIKNRRRWDAIPQYKHPYPRWIRFTFHWNSWFECFLNHLWFCTLCCGVFRLAIFCSLYSIHHCRAEISSAVFCFLIALFDFHQHPFALITVRKKGCWMFVLTRGENVWGKWWRIESSYIFVTSAAQQNLLGLLPGNVTKSENDKILQRKVEQPQEETKRNLIHFS